MIDHTADHNIMLRTSRDALWRHYTVQKNLKKNEPAKPNQPRMEDNPFVDDLATKLTGSTYKPEIAFKSKYDTFACLVASKARNSTVFSPLFVYRRATHLFEDKQLWESILDKEVLNGFFLYLPKELRKLERSH